MIFRAPEPDVVIPETALTPFLMERALRQGDKPAFIDGPTGRTITHRQWVDLTRKAAAGLTSRGFGKGDVFAIFSPNLPEYAVAFHAVSLVGGINTTINPTYTVAELAQQLKDAGARYLVTVPPCAEKALDAARQSGVQEVFVFGEAEGATPFATLLSGEGDPPAVTIDPRRDLVVLPYSSGTTGIPKGVMLTHHNLVANFVQSAAAMCVEEDDVLLGVLPFFHIYGMTVIMNFALYLGATVVTLPRFDLEQCLSTIQKYGVTAANVVPPIVLALAKHPLVDKYQLGSLRFLLSGAAPLTEHLAAAAAARLGCRVMQGYGLTETSPVTHATRMHGPQISAGSIGPPVPNTEVKVVDVATGAMLSTCQEGEICIRGPQVMRGYWNRPDATSAMIDADGWLHTGDIGYADENGCFFIVDRLKELIKYKGLQIAPAELEAVLLGHPGVADAAVIPIADECAGEVPKAYVVLKGSAESGDVEGEIMQYVAERVAPYKKLRAIEITPQIPKSPSGKILRRLLVDQERARAAANQV
jgi:acyl-CoA synthetase (AMP-forming)/AMP-acid ligase II